MGIKDISHYDWEAGLVGLIITLLTIAFIIIPSCTRVSEIPVEAVTVKPHPTMGMELVIVPAGTKVDGIVTTEPGLLFTGKALFGLLTRLAECQEYEQSHITDNSEQTLRERQGRRDLSAGDAPSPEAVQ